jgi:hypothetical protein
VERGDYLGALVRFGTRLEPAKTASDEGRAQYLGRVVGFGAKLKTEERDAAEAGVEAFRRVLGPRAQDILWRVAGATLDRRRQLSPASRDALRVMEVEPDLLGPLGDARTEVAHSSALAFFLDPTRSGGVGGACLASFVELVARVGGADAEEELPDLTDARVTSERVLGRWGRVDVSIDGPNALIFVEVKVDAGEGPEQLSRYAKAMAELAGERESLLVFLTDDVGQAGNGDGHRHVTFSDVLAAWLPIAATTRSPEATYLAMYLKTIARHLRHVAGRGAFDQWDLHTQRAALEFIQRESET